MFVQLFYLAAYLVFYKLSLCDLQLTEFNMHGWKVGKKGLYKNIPLYKCLTWSSREVHPAIIQTELFQEITQFNTKCDVKWVPTTLNKVAGYCQEYFQYYKRHVFKTLYFEWAINFNTFRFRDNRPYHVVNWASCYLLYLRGSNIDLWAISTLCKNRCSNWRGK